MPKKGPKSTMHVVVAGMESADGSAMMVTLSARGPLPEDHPLYTDIGRVAAQWAHLEHLLDLIIWDLASIRHEKGACITGQLIGASPRYYAIIALAMTHGIKQQTIDIIQELMRKTINLSEERNRIVHDAWYLESPSGKTFQFRSMPRKDPAYGFKEIESAKIAYILERIQRRIDSVSNLRSTILDELQPSS
jgi:hypothetical protein